MDDVHERGSYGVGRKRRELILDAALQRFTEVGYARVSLAEIARDVGITAPGLAHHFPSKQHLLLAIAERRFDLASEYADQAPRVDDGTSALRTMLGIAEMFAAQPHLMELWAHVAAEAADPTSTAHSLFAARYERTIDALVAQFEAEVDLGRVRDDIDYRDIARECVAVADGLQLQWVLTAGRIDFVGLTRAHLERVALSILVVRTEVDLSVLPDA